MRIGFEEIGVWTLEGSDLVARYTKELEILNALVAYVSNDAVVYITRQRKADQGLSVRLDRVIKSFIGKGRELRIYALTDWNPCEHRGMRINVAAGLEEELIERMQPPWNQARRL